MFRNRARIEAFRPHAVPQVAPVHCNNKWPDRRPAAAGKQAGRQRLACHWRVAAAGGRLECWWEIERPDAAPAEPPGPSWAAKYVLGLRSPARHPSLELV
jgi:hypothetical protein